MLVYEETEYESLTEDIVTSAQVSSFSNLNSNLWLWLYDAQISATGDLYKKLTPEVVELFLNEC